MGKLEVGTNAWKPAAKSNVEVTREQGLQREVNALLNKVCPENVDAIIDKVAAVNVRDSEEMEMIIKLLFSKAMNEPHYCDTYVAMVAALKVKMPEFPATSAGGEEGARKKNVTFKAVLLNTCQSEFESLNDILAFSEEELKTMDVPEQEHQRKKRKGRVLANMKFIGKLFLASLLSAKIIGSVIQELTNCDRADEMPQEPMVECICELLTTIGYTLEMTPVGKASLVSVCGRLKDLKGRKQGGKEVYSKRIQFGIQDVLEMRAAAWTKRTFKETAKTKEEIKKQQDKEIKMQQSGKVFVGELQRAC